MRVFRRNIKRGIQGRPRMKYKFHPRGALVCLYRGGRNVFGGGEGEAGVS